MTYGISAMSDIQMPFAIAAHWCLFILTVYWCALMYEHALIRSQHKRAWWYDCIIASTLQSVWPLTCQSKLPERWRKEGNGAENCTKHGQSYQNDNTKNSLMLDIYYDQFFSEPINPGRHSKVGKCFKLCWNNCISFCKTAFGHLVMPFLMEPLRAVTIEAMLCM